MSRGRGRVQPILCESNLQLGTSIKLHERMLQTNSSCITQSIFSLQEQRMLETDRKGCALPVATNSRLVASRAYTEVNCICCTVRICTVLLRYYFNPQTFAKGKFPKSRACHQTATRGFVLSCRSVRNPLHRRQSALHSRWSHDVRPSPVSDSISRSCMWYIVLRSAQWHV